MKASLANMPSMVMLQASQPGTDTFIDAWYPTNLSTASTSAWKLEKIEFWIDFLNNPISATDGSIAYQLALGHLYTELLASESPAVIIQNIINFSAFGTTPVGVVRTPGYFEWNPPPGDFIIAPAFLSLLLDSSGLAAQAEVTCRIYHRVVDLPEIDILRLNTCSGVCGVGGSLR